MTRTMQAAVAWAVGFSVFLAAGHGAAPTVGAESAPGRAAAPPVQTAARSANDLAARALKISPATPDAQFLLGLSEICRAAGKNDLAAKNLHAAGDLLAAMPQGDKARGLAVRVHELACWRMMPVGRDGLAQFAAEMDAIAALDAGNSWLCVYRLYAAAVANDRAAMVAAAGKISDRTAPTEFPYGWIEPSHLGLLRRIGLTPSQGGLEVIWARDHDPLRALRDLDATLGREAEYFTAAENWQGAAGLTTARDRLRGAYASAARHLVERLFALNLLGQAAKRDELVAAAAKLPYLQNRTALANLFATLPERQTWALVVKPTLDGELALIASPPDLAAIVPEPLQMKVQAKSRTDQGDIASYVGAVKVSLAGLAIACDHLAVVAAGGDRVMLAGAGAVSITGLPGISEAAADRFTFSTETGVFSLAGNISLRWTEGTSRLTACTVTVAGAARDERSLLDDFRAASTTAEKLALLPKITAVYPDAELPDAVLDAQLLLALDLVRPHLTWHGRFLTPISRLAVQDRRAPAGDRAGSMKWREADQGDDLLRTLYTPAQWEAIIKAVAKAERDEADRARDRELAAGRAWLQAEQVDEKAPFWLLDDPAHPDVARALKLFDTVAARSTDRKLRERAARWAAEIRCNNTALTFDVCGSYAAGAPGPIVMDVRAAEKVSFKLYRARGLDDLRAAVGRIGDDFIYRDYGLQNPVPEVKVQLAELAQQLMDIRSQPVRAEAAIPSFRQEDLVGQWECRVADLKVLGDRLRTGRGHMRDIDEWEGGDDPEAEFFGDSCRQYYMRMNKEYGPRPGQWSSWQCDRIVQIPKDSLAGPGGYVLVAEANGERACAPILVDALGLTLRRCKDGVFALVSTPEGRGPAPGAKLDYADMSGAQGNRQQHTAFAADAEGAAFVRVLAFGDRAILAEKDGRYAIGGFGKVFDGVYRPEDSYRQMYLGLRQARAMRAMRIGSVGEMAYAYEDRWVAVAYTDRPTYRPGQEVNFKLILRRIGHDDAAQPGGTGPGPRQSDGARPAPAGPAEQRDRRASTVPAAPEMPREFRAQDFDFSRALSPPPEGTAVHFDVVNPRGRVVGGGNLVINDFGTAAAKVALSDEAATGTYSLRITLDGHARIVPDVFAVKFYRRPNFELTVAGVPEKVGPAGTLALALSGQYYFGKPVAGGKVDARVVRPDQWQPLARAGGEMDAAGKAALKLTVPADLSGGEYYVLCSLTDESGRTVTASRKFTLDRPDRAKAATGLDQLPRFVAAGEIIAVSAGAAEIAAEANSGGSSARTTFKAERGAARIKLDRPGWYVLSAGDQKTDLYVYGGSEPPEIAFRQLRQEEERRELRAGEVRRSRPAEPRWVNLTDYTLQGNGEDEYGDYFGRWQRRRDNPAYDLWVLFDRHHAKVGDKLRLLTYLPAGARLALTIEGKTVVDYVLAQVPAAEKGSYHVIEIPVKERYLPNFYLQGRIVAFDGGMDMGEWYRKLFDRQQQRAMRMTLEQMAAEDVEDPGEDPQWCRVDVLGGAASEKDAPPALGVSVRTDAKDYRPGQNVAVQVRVTDAAGRPVGAEVSLAAVDESVYSFGEDYLAALPRMFADSRLPRTFYPKVWRGSVGGSPLARSHVAMAMMREQQLARQMEMAMENAANALQQAQQLAELAPTAGQIWSARAMLTDLGAQMPSASFFLSQVRTDFRETAAWLPQLRTNADGLATASFKLPDSLTAYRLSAVALTRDTRIGLGRAALKASLPLSVQVFLPRFAVQKDRLLAVALVHNNTAADRVCQVAWEVEGAAVEGPSAGPGDWQTASRDGRTVVAGSVNVPAGRSARADLWLACRDVGTASLTFRAAGGDDRDAEVRRIPVHALGQQRDVAMTGEFTRAKTITLPEGFVAADLRLTLGRADVSKTLDGLAGLVNYPYGCVEQTMSTFLPAVMVKHAVGQLAIPLPPDVQQKLPDVLAKGLERLYNFQHADGGWGWWEKDQTDNQMTVYVVYGLARCQAAGMKVDSTVLSRGCEYLGRQISLGALAGKAGQSSHGMRNLEGNNLEARAWHAVALAGKADKGRLAAVAEAALPSGHGTPAVPGRSPPAELAPEGLCNLALACSEAGLADLGDRLWAAARKWQPDATDQLALKLSAQVAYRAGLSECRATADKLIARRKGTLWESTRATSWAIEALAQMLRFDVAKTPARQIRVDVGARTVLDVTSPDDLKKFVQYVHLGPSDLGGKEAVELRLVSDGDQAVTYSLFASGTQRLDAVEPSGKEVRLTRRHEMLDGRPIGPALKVGDVIAVRSTVDLEQDTDYLIIEDRRPAGCEFADDRVGGPARDRTANVEFRDDRLCVFFTRLPAGRHELVYHLRAETPGTSHVLPGCAWPMYAARLRGETASASLTIVAARQ